MAPADQPFTITFDNEDADIPHNIQIFTDSTTTKSLDKGPTVTGVDTQTYDVGELAAGSYYFHCDFHPTTMTGTFAVVKGAK